MPPLKVSFKLENRDLKYLRRLMRKAAAASRSQSETALLARAEQLARRIRTSRAPDYVLARVDTLETLTDMARDRGWRLPAAVRRQIFAVLSYFADPHDLIPDSLPGLGFLDDAIIIELAARDLRHELKAYRDFCRFRDREEYRPPRQLSKAALQARLSAKREQLYARIPERAISSARDAKRASRLLRP